jgi:hypothetical protein
MVERGFLRAHDLYKCLTEQVAEIFHNMMLAKEGRSTGRESVRRDPAHRPWRGAKERARRFMPPRPDRRDRWELYFALGCPDMIG